MINEIRTSGPRGLNKGLGSTFHIGSRVRQALEEIHIRQYFANIILSTSVGNTAYSKPTQLTLNEEAAYIEKNKQ